MSDTYKIPCECSNCDQSCEVAIAKGTPCDGPQTCPNCGCETATKKARVPVVSHTPTWQQPGIGITTLLPSVRALRDHNLLASN